MLRMLVLAFISSILLSSPVMAEVEPEPVTLTAADGVSIPSDYYKAEKPRALILLFHQAGSNRGEYSTIAPKLVSEGYSALAIDQRSGGKLFGRDNEVVKRLGRNGKYLDARKDLEAALIWAKSQQLPVMIWGSSYSAALTFLVAAHHPSDIAAVLAFSPGEYLGDDKMVRTAAAKVSVPVFVTSAKDDEEVSAAKQILAASPSAKKTQFVPKIAGVHGSSTLRADRNPKGMGENWQAVLAFLTSVAPQ